MAGFDSFIKNIVRLLIGLAAGVLIGYEYYSFSLNPDEALPYAVGMALVTAVIVAFMMRGLGKGSGD
ncbi:Uncharacterised protein [Candidatus Burarchaeum australiense]|nr:Uncharacterised protein [Candidatus Burarchaeum australiense]